MATFSVKRAMNWSSPAMTTKLMTKAVTCKDIFAHPDKCVILDTETTGTRNSDRIVECSIIDLNGKIIFNSLINPLMAIPEEATKVNGITNKDVAGMPFFEDVADQIIAAIEGKLVLAWFAAFDQRMINSELARCGKEAGARWEDAMPLYCRDAGKSHKRLALYKAMAEQGITKSQSHRSLGDCQDTLAVLRSLEGKTDADLFSGVNDVFDGLKSPEEKTPDTAQVSADESAVHAPHVAVYNLSAMEDEEL